jgi:hypothetical protein
MAVLELVQPCGGADRHNAADGTWTNTGSLKTARFHHTATLLSDGNVLAAGGAGLNNAYLPSAELFTVVQ